MVFQLALITLVVSLTLGAIILMRAPSVRLNQIFAGICLGVAMVHGGRIADDLGAPDFGCRLAFVGLGLLIVSSPFFFSRFPDVTTLPERSVWIGLSALTALLALAPEGLWLPRDAQLKEIPWLLDVAGLLTLASLLRCLNLLLRQLGATDNPFRQLRLRILFWSSVVMIAALLLQRIPDAPEFGSLAAVIYLYFLYQALVRFRLLDLQEILGRGMVLTLQTALLTLIFWILRPSEQHFLFSLAVAIATLCVLFEPLHRAVETLSRRLIFYRHVHFENLIEKLRDQLPTKLTQDETIDHAFQGLRTSGRVSHASVYLIDPDFAALRLLRSMGAAPEFWPPTHVSARLLRYLEHKPKPLVRDDLARRRDESERSDQKSLFATLVDSLDILHAQVCLPLVTTSGDILGILNLRDEGNEEAFSRSEIRLLVTLAGQLATVLRTLQLANQMIESDRLRALGEMAAGLAHEIRNPLGAIKGAAQILQTSPAGNPTNPQNDSKFVRIIVEESDRLNRVLTQFLDFARSDSRPPKLVDINSVVRRTVDVVKAQAGTNGVRIDMHLAGELPAVRIDPERMEQVFLNLALNGVQAVNHNGRVEISTQPLAGGQVEITFADSGPGVAADDVKKIFAPFYTTKESGTGLGLAICQRIIADHAGEIFVESNGPLGGACFKVRLST